MENNTMAAKAYSRLFTKEFPHSPFSSKRVFFIGLFAACVAAYFWTQSRYPALNMKALMGGRAPTLGISFDVIYAPVNTDTRIVKVLKNTYNWYFTNWKGMTFGIIFGGALLSLLGMFRFRGFKSSHLNALAGAVFGAPLGVCANCTAPISRVLQKSGYALETAMGTLFGSPTLNVVVLTMAFALLPSSMAVLKVVMTAVMILLVVPYLSRKVGGSRTEECETPAIFVPVDEVKEGWLKGFWESFKLLARGIFFLFRTTVPQMLLAGLLGTIMVEFVPLERLIQMPFSIPGALMLGVVGTFLPVPMTFDVILTAILLDGGLHPVYGMILLFTLGTFSIYPMILIWQSVSSRFAGSVYASVAALGLTAGIAYHFVSGSQAKQAVGDLDALMQQGHAAVKRAEELLGRNCASLPMPYSEQCVLKAARDIESRSICELLKSPDQVSDCQVMLRGKELAMDLQGCDEFTDPAKKAVCMSGAIQEVILQRKENGRLEVGDFCRSNTDPRYFSACRQFKAANLGKANWTVSTCEDGGSPTEQHDCIEALLRTRLFPAYSVRVCDGLKPGSDNDLFCRAAVVLKSNKHGESRMACDSITDPALREHCASLRIERRAASRGRPQACDNVLPQHRERCLMGAYAAEAKNAIHDANLTAANRIFDQANEGRAPGGSPGAFDDVEQVAVSTAKSIPLVEKLVQDSGGIRIVSTPYQPRKAASGKAPFSKREAIEFGMALPDIRPGELRGTASLVGRGLAAADYDQDGWQDLVYATRQGPYIYRNLGGLKFERAPVSVEGGISTPDFDLVGISWVDINNDGRLDLFCSSVMGEAYFLLGNEKGFRDARRVALPNPANRSSSRGYAFYDVDGDGWLDVFLGSWTSSSFPYQFTTSENHFYYNRNMKWVPSSAYQDRIKGETLSVLMSDLNQDGAVDLFIANDMQGPDEIFMGAGKGKFREIKAGDKTLPYTSFGSMSYDSGDINNDLRLDVFTSDVVFDTASNDPFCAFVKNDDERKRCELVAQVYQSSRRGDMEGCKLAPTLADQVDCAAAGIVRMASVSRRRGICDDIPDSAYVARRRCQQVFEYQPIFYDHPEGDLRQSKGNTLFVQEPNGTFKDMARAMGVYDSGWGWNGRFADFNNDGWLDIYVSSGSIAHNQRGTNHLFLNEGGKKFARATKSAGVEEVFLSSASVMVDLANDGNLDIVSNSVVGPARVYLNAGTGNSIGFSLRSKDANPYQVGASIVIRTTDGQQQIREVKASGGYLSFDPYVQHFGLGANTSVEKVSVRWADGRKTELAGPFEANRKYVVSR